MVFNSFDPYFPLLNYLCYRNWVVATKSLLCQTKQNMVKIKFVTSIKVGESDSLKWCGKIIWPGLFSTRKQCKGAPPSHQLYGGLVSLKLSGVPLPLTKTTHEASSRHFIYSMHTLFQVKYFCSLLVEADH